MTRNIFSGTINDKKFNNIDEFRKYLNEHQNEVTSISFSTSEEEIPSEDEEKIDVSSKQILYPEMLTPDEFIEKYPDDYDAGLDDVAESLYDQNVKHAEIIKTLENDVLVDHRSNISKMHAHTEHQLELSEEALKQVETKIENLQEKLNNLCERKEILEAGLNLTELYVDNFSVMLEQIDDEIKERKLKSVPKKKDSEKVNVQGNKIKNERVSKAYDLNDVLNNFNKIFFKF